MAEPAVKNTTSLKAGDFAPDFTLDTADGSPITLSELRGQNVIVYFYPKDDTPGCTIEAKDFSAQNHNFDDINTKIIAISKDSVETHCKFRDKYNLSIILASDPKASVCQAYDTWVEKNMYGKKYMGIQRDTFLIDTQGVIRKVWRKVKPDGHAEEVLEAVRDL